MSKMKQTLILFQCLTSTILASEYPPVLDQQLANWERPEEDRFRRSFNPYKTGKETANEMSQMLDDLLAGSIDPATQRSIAAFLLVGFGTLISLFPFHSWAAPAAVMTSSPLNRPMPWST